MFSIFLIFPIVSHIFYCIYKTSSIFLINFYHPLRGIWHVPFKETEWKSNKKKKIFDAADDSVSATTTKHSNNSKNKNIIQDLIWTHSLLLVELFFFYYFLNTSNAYRRIKSFFVFLIISHILQHLRICFSISMNYCEALAVPSCAFQISQQYSDKKCIQSNELILRTENVANLFEYLLYFICFIFFIFLHSKLKFLWQKWLSASKNRKGYNSLNIWGIFRYRNSISNCYSSIFYENALQDLSYPCN